MRGLNSNRRNRFSVVSRSMTGRPYDGAGGNSEIEVNSMSDVDIIKAVDDS